MENLRRPALAVSGRTWHRSIGLSVEYGLCRGVSPGDYGPNGGAAFDDLMMQLMEAHQPQASPTSRDALSALPRRKVRSASTPSDVFSNTPSDLPAACACGEPCSVCHDNMEEHSEVVELPCQHCYHEDCITSWLKDVSSQPCARPAFHSPYCTGHSLALQYTCTPTVGFDMPWIIHSSTLAMSVSLCRVLQKLSFLWEPTSPLHAALL